MFYYSIIFLISINLFRCIDASHPPLPISNGNCTYQYGSRTMHEGEYIVIQKKIYKVEDCYLHRAYRTCGKHLWLIINIACDAIQGKGKILNRRAQQNTNEILLTDACCRSACTINEMTRYCPN